MSATIHNLERHILPLVIIILGILLRFKLGTQKDFSVVKDIYQFALLPSTILVSLTNLSLDASALIWPGFGLMYNVVVFLMLRMLCSLALPRQVQNQTLNLICLEACNLAPGLSSWAFIDNFNNPALKGLLAFADFGNKFFAIFVTRCICYWLARRSLQEDGAKRSSCKVLGNMLSKFLSEPVTIACVLGLLFSAFGLQCEQISFFCPALDRISKGTLPVLLLYIGAKLHVPSVEHIFVVSLLITRAGLGLLLAAFATNMLPLDNEQNLGVVLFFQSSCGYMPLSSMGSVSQELSQNSRDEDKFHLDTPSDLLALSFPISILVLFVISFFEEWFVIPRNLIAMGFIFISTGLIGATIVSRMSTNFSWKEYESEKNTKTTGGVMDTTIVCKEQDNFSWDMDEIEKSFPQKNRKFLRKSETVDTMPDDESIESYA